MREDRPSLPWSQTSLPLIDRYHLPFCLRAFPLMPISCLPQSLQREAVLPRAVLFGNAWSPKGDGCQSQALGSLAGTRRSGWREDHSLLPWAAEPFPVPGVFHELEGGCVEGKGEPVWQPRLPLPPPRATVRKTLEGARNARLLRCLKDRKAA